jgi:hypothetical protein
MGHTDTPSGGYRRIFPCIESVCSRLLESWSAEKMSLDAKGAVDGCVDIREALRGAWRLETHLFALSASDWLV